MKRFLKYFVILIFMLCFAGCGDIEADSIITETSSVTIESVYTEPCQLPTEATQPMEPTEAVISTEPVPTEQVRWEIPDEEYIIDISRPAETDHEKLAWAIYLEGGADTVCDDCRRRIGDTILNLVECKITNTGNDFYWPDTITGVISGGGINPYQNMGNSCSWPESAHKEDERHAVERAYRIAYEVLTGQHSEIYRKGYFYYAGDNVYGWEPETAIYHCGIFFMRQRGWDNSKFEQDWVLSFD